MIPTYEECMLPTLQALADGTPHSAKEVRQYIINHFSLTEEEQQMMMPNKRVRRLNSKSGWAITYMKVAGLIQAIQRGVYTITPAGKKLLASNLEAVNTKMLLERYPIFRSWYNRSIGKDDTNEVIQNNPSENVEITPEEQIEGAYQQMRSALVEDLLEQIAQQTPEFFERLVIRLLVAMGYGGSEEEISEMVVGKPGDGGIDGVIKQDKLGLDRIYIQAKRWKNNAVGSSEIRDFVGALSIKNATKGIFITSSRFPQNIHQDIQQIHDKKVALIDGALLCQYMLDYNIGVSVQNVYEIKRIDSDFFSEE
jgi:mrr restriction system protein